MHEHVSQGSNATKLHIHMHVNKPPMQFTSNRNTVDTWTETFQNSVPKIPIKNEPAKDPFNSFELDRSELSQLSLINLASPAYHRLYTWGLPFPADPIHLPYQRRALEELRPVFDTHKTSIQSAQLLSHPLGQQQQLQQNWLNRFLSITTKNMIDRIFIAIFRVCGGEEEVWKFSEAHSYRDCLDDNKSCQWTSDNNLLPRVITTGWRGRVHGQGHD